MNKSISKEKKIQQSVDMGNNFDLLYTIHNMGLHWKIPMEDYSIDFYPTTHSWYDPSTKAKGKGLESFLIYIGKTEPDE